MVNVLDFASRLPHRLNCTLRRNKILLRCLVQTYLPLKVANAKKNGFGIPIDSWLEEEGRVELSKMLTAPQAGIRGLVNEDYVDSLLKGFVERDWDKSVTSRYMLYQRVYMLWSLERWLMKWKPTL